MKLSRVEIRSVLKRVQFGLGSGCPFSGYFGKGLIGSGNLGLGQFWVILQFGFPAVMDRFTSGVRVQIGSSHFGCRFGYGFGSFGSGFGSRVSFARSIPPS